MARILVIDDDELILSTLVLLLTGAGYAVDSASDGLLAEKLFRASSYELIITDIVMPNREGLETILLLRREFPQVKVIAMSGGTGLNSSYLDIALRLGAHCILPKPFTGQQLRDASPRS